MPSEVGVCCDDSLGIRNMVFFGMKFLILVCYAAHLLVSLFAEREPDWFSRCSLTKKKFVTQIILCVHLVIFVCLFFISFRSSGVLVPLCGRWPSF